MTAFFAMSGSRVAWRRLMEGWLTRWYLRAPTKLEETKTVPDDFCGVGILVPVS